MTTNITRRVPSCVTKEEMMSDITGAGKWLKKAEEGDEFAQLQMGTACFRGDGLPQDFENAYKWWSKSAKQGNIDALIKKAQLLEVMRDMGKNALIKEIKSLNDNNGGK